MNDTADINGGDNAQAVAIGQLRAFVERRERLEADKAEIAEDIKELNQEVRSAGFNMRAYNEMVKLRKLDKAERDERETIRSLYAESLGVFS